MNHRLTIAAAVAVILASVSIFSLINGAAWYVQAAGAAIIVALAGTLTRVSPVPAAIGASVLAVIACVPLLAAWSPYLKAAGAALILICVASASGLRPLRAVAGLVTYLAALLIYLNLLHAAGQSFLAVIPTPHSLHHLAKLVSDGASAGRFSPPVPGHHGVILLAAGSIGLVAIAVDFLAVRLHRPAIAGPSAAGGLHGADRDHRTGTRPGRRSRVPARSRRLPCPALLRRPQQAARLGPGRHGLALRGRGRTARRRRHGSAGRDRAADRPRRRLRRD